MNEVVLCEENSWLPIPGLLTVLELRQQCRSVMVGLRAFLLLGLPLKII